MGGGPTPSRRPGRLLLPGGRVLPRGEPDADPDRPRPEPGDGEDAGARAPVPAPRPHDRAARRTAPVPAPRDQAASTGGRAGRGGARRAETRAGHLRARALVRPGRRHTPAAFPALARHAHLIAGPSRPALTGRRSTGA